MKEKWCNKGQHSVPVSNFSKLSSAKDGLQVKCKDCARNHYESNKDLYSLRNKKHREENKDSHRKYAKQYYKQNREQMLAKSAAYFESNKEAILVRQAERYRNDEALRARVAAWGKKRKSESREQISEAHREYYKSNRNKIRETARQYYDTNKDEFRNRSRKWREYNLEASNLIKQKYRARKLSAAGDFTAEQWQAKLEYWGWCCYLCGVQVTRETMHIEHRIPLSRGGSNWLANLAPACKTCNLRKGAKTEVEYIGFVSVPLYLSLSNVV